MFPNDYKISYQKHFDGIKKSHKINKNPQRNKAVKYRNELREEEDNNSKTVTKEETKKQGGLDLYF